MELSLFLTFGSATAAAAIVFAALWLGRKATAYWHLAAGMALLAVESIFCGLTVRAASPEQMLYWQNWRFSVTAFLPGTFLLFSLSYGRENAWNKLIGRQWTPLAGLGLPAAIVLIFR